MVGVPLIKHGQFIATVIVEHTKVRSWTDGVISLVQDVAERTWAAIERAKVEQALREAEESYTSKLEHEVEERTKELKESNMSLRYANENLQQFASIASHDLQEPLRKMQMFVSVLRRFAQNLPEEGKELISKIKLTSERMSQLIREVLHYSKIANSPKEFVLTNLDTVLKNVFVDLELLMKESEATIEYLHPLPEIEAIPSQINQLLYNLLVNALKFRNEGISLIINISCNFLPLEVAQRYSELIDDKSYVEIIFSDNGIGFNQQYAKQIFEIFERLHSVDEFEGTGVGLALCKKIVENHRGHIYAMSTEQQGASFHVVLPIK